MQNRSGIAKNAATRGTSQAGRGTMPRRVPCGCDWQWRQQGRSSWLQWGMCAGVVRKLCGSWHPSALPPLLADLRPVRFLPRLSLVVPGLVLLVEVVMGILV